MQQLLQWTLHHLCTL